MQCNFIYLLASLTKEYNSFLSLALQAVRRGKATACLPTALLLPAQSPEAATPSARSLRACRPSLQQTRSLALQGVRSMDRSTSSPTAPRRLVRCSQERETCQEGTNQGHMRLQRTESAEGAVGTLSLVQGMRL